MNTTEKAIKLDREMTADRWGMELKNLFSAARLRLGLSMTRAGEGADVATSIISRIERECTKPGRDTITKLRDFYIAGLEAMKGIDIENDAMLQALREVDPYRPFVNMEENHLWT